MNLPFIRINPLGAFVLCALIVFLVYLYTGSVDKTSDLSVVSLKHMLSISVTAAELGGLKVKEIRRSEDIKQKSKGKTKEGANDPVTYGDLLSHKAMLYTLKNSFPSVEIVSEEHDDSDIKFLDINHPPPPWTPVDKFLTDIVVPAKDILVWIDPLDATQEYTENLLQYVTTMVCIAIKGKPIIGVIHKPFENSTVQGKSDNIVSEEHDDSDIKFLDINHPPPPWTPVDKFLTDIVVPAKDILVWIDPLDATQEYTENLLQYVTTMVCIAIKGKPIIGVIHKPFENSTVWGWVGKGISDPNYASGGKRDQKNSPRIIVSRSHAGEVEKVAKTAFGPDTEIIPAGGAGYKSLQVIEGNADAYIHTTLIKKWDICPGHALLNAVGGKMTQLDGSEIEYGDSSLLKNEKGLIATLYDHEKFVKKLSKLVSFSNGNLQFNLKLSEL
nr:inositol monophosphatase 3 [Parasteatoda tepidariorum]